MLAARLLGQLWLVMVLRVGTPPDHLAGLAEGIFHHRGDRTVRNMALPRPSTWNCRGDSRSHRTGHVNTGIADSSTSRLGRIVGDCLDDSCLRTYLGRTAGLARNILF